MPLSETTARAERDRLYHLLEDVLDIAILTPLLRERIESAMEEIDGRYIHAYNDKIERKRKEPEFWAKIMNGGKPA